MLIEVIALSVAVTALLTLVGFGLVVLLLPDMGGGELLLSPAVGLGVLYFSCQWLSPKLPSSTIVMATCVAGGFVSVTAAVARRDSLLARLRALRLDAAVVLPLALITCVALQLPMLHLGVFTLADSGGDTLFTWAPVADHMRDHAFGSGEPPIGSPLLWILPANPYPGSSGTVDGGLEAIFGLDGYQFVGPLTAICLALVVIGVYALVTLGLRMPRRIAVLAAVLAAASPFRYVIAGLGIAQSARAAVLLVGALTLFFIALRTRSYGAAVLGGGIAALLSAVYMPIFIVLFAGMAAAVLTLLATHLVLRRQPANWKPVVVIAVSGVVIGAKNVRWLLFKGGISDWINLTHYKDLGAKSYPLSSMMGSAADPSLGLPSTLTAPDTWQTASTIIALVALVVMAAGAVALVRTRRTIECAGLLGALTYAFGVVVISHGGFGARLSASYIVPLISVLIAVGAAWLGGQASAASATPTAPRRLPRWALGAMFLVPVLGFQVVAAAQTTASFVSRPGLLPPANLAIRGVASVIPVGSTVLVYGANGTDLGSTMSKSSALTAAMMFLPDRRMSIAGRPFGGFAQPGDVGEVEGLMALRYDYILHATDPAIVEAAIPTEYRMVWSSSGLVLYHRGG